MATHTFTSDSATLSRLGQAIHAVANQDPTNRTVSIVVNDAPTAAVFSVTYPNGAVVKI